MSIFLTILLPLEWLQQSSSIVFECLNVSPSTWMEREKEIERFKILEEELQESGDEEKNRVHEPLLQWTEWREWLPLELRNWKWMESSRNCGLERTCVLWYFDTSALLRLDVLCNIKRSTFYGPFGWGCEISLNINGLINGINIKLN